MRSIRWGGGDGVSADDHEADFMRCAGGDELAESRFSTVGLEQLPDGYRAAAELAAALCGMHRLRAADATDQATAIAAGGGLPEQGQTPFRDARDGPREESADEAMSASAAAESQIESQTMDMLLGEQIAEAKLTDWRKLAQGLHARYVVDDFGTGARFVAAVGEAGDALGHHPSVSIGRGYVDLKLVSADAIYRDAEGTEHVVEWVTQQDVDLARRITEIAADHGIEADPSSVSMIELGLDTADSATIAPVWAALLTGNPEAQGHGSPSDEIRDAMGRVPNLWFGDADEGDAPRQRFHVEVYVAPEVAEQRIAAAVAAGGTVVDDSDAPGLTVIADQDGNRGVLCVDTSAATKD